MVDDKVAKRRLIFGKGRQRAALEVVSMTRAQEENALGIDEIKALISPGCTRTRVRVAGMPEYAIPVSVLTLLPERKAAKQLVDVTLTQPSAQRSEADFHGEDEREHSTTYGAMITLALGMGRLLPLILPGTSSSQFSS